MGDNGKDQIKKRCPFNNQWCDDACALIQPMNIRKGVSIVTENMCCFIATNMILSEVNQRLANQTQQVINKINPLKGLQIPGINRG